MRHEYTFDKEFNGLKFNLQYSCNGNNPALIWEVPSEKYINLWYNEMQGQISDGMWENSWGTEWLWKNPIFFVKGKQCKLYTKGWVDVKRKSYSIRGFLKYDWFLERLPEETGVETFAEAKAIWNEMNEAIKNVESVGESAYVAWIEVYQKSILEKQKEIYNKVLVALRKSCPEVSVGSCWIEYSVKDLLKEGCYPNRYSLYIVKERLLDIQDLSEEGIKNARVIRLDKEGYCSINTLPEVMRLKAELSNVLNFKGV